MSKSRLEALSDGVFAIAITLLVLSIAQPPSKDYAHLTHSLTSLWPSLVAYVVSFAVIGIMWLNHHSIFGHLERVDRPFVYLNLLLLLTVVFIPYPTHIFGQALAIRSGGREAAVFYSLTMTVNACSWAALWLYASLRRRLLVEQFPEVQRRLGTFAFTSGTFVYAASIAVAFANPYACLAFHGLLAVYYATDPLSRLVGRRQPANLEVPPDRPL